MVHPKHLIVEDNEDKHTVVHLMRNHVDWPDANWPVEVKIGRSADEIINRSFLSIILKQSGLQALGIVLDADEVFEARWRRLRRILIEFVPKVPNELPEEGLICANEEGLRLGVWMMPDNRSSGMLETFLRLLIRREAARVWEYAQLAVRVAKRRGAPYRDAHRDKACIHTWLAWQDPPGERFGIAITIKMLDPHAPSAAAFVDWFRNLYDL